MPIDASIYNNIQVPQPQDQLAKFAQIQQIQQMQNQSRLADLAYGEQERGIAADKTMAQALAHGGSPEEVQTALAQRGYGKAALNYGSTNQEILHKQAETKAANSKSEKDLSISADNKFKLTKQQQDQATQYLSSQIQDPNLNVDGVISHVKAAITAGAIDPKTGQAKIDELSDPSYKDPEVLRKHLGDALYNMISPEKRLENDTAIRGHELAAKTSTANNAATQAGENSRAAASRVIEAAKVDPFGILGINKNATQTGKSGSGLTGEDYLATLPPGLQTQVKAIAEGRMAVTPRTLQSPQGAALMQMIGQYDPSFDLVDYNKRNRTATGFASGKQGDTLKNINQAISHAGQLSDSIDALNNSNGIATPLNSVVNPVQEFFGDSRQGTFRQKALAVSSELRKVYAGSGGGNLSELNKWEGSLPENASQEQQRIYLKSGLELLNGAIDSLNNQYQTGMGTKANIMDNGSLISPEAKATLARISGKTQTASPQAAQVPADIQALLLKHGKK